MDLPNEFDVIILGTGMPESVVAAAFARIGQSVLHLDKNDHYSADWASFNLQGIEKWTEQHKANADVIDSIKRPDVDANTLLEDGEKLIEMPLNYTCFSNAHSTYHVIDVEEETTTEAIVKQINQTTLQESLQTECGNEDTQTNSENKDDVHTDKNSVEKTQESEVKSSAGDGHAVSETAEGNTNSNATANEQQILKKDTQSDSPAVQLNEETDKDQTLQSSKEVEPEEKIPDVEKDQTLAEGNTVETCEATNIHNEDVVKVKEAEKAKGWTLKRIKSEWRRFNIDLSPKVLFSRGVMVKLLIESDIAKYCEFKTVTQVLTILNGQLEKVPCSRADVFSSKQVSMLEKRMLMKFIQFCLNIETKQDEIKDYLDKPFSEFLASRKLTPTIQHYVQHSIAMATNSMTTKQGLEQMKKFLESLGHYGNTAFLWSLYGSGELPQCFCRMCAVFGGVYCLRTTASAMIMDKENKCSGIITTDGQKIKCKWLIMESSYAPETFVKVSSQRSISRAILMTDRPLLTQDQQEQLSLMCIPCADDGDRPVFVLQLPPSSMAAPAGIYITHLTRVGVEGVAPAEDLAYVIQTLFSTEVEAEVEDNKPQILWSLYFTQEDRSEVQASTSVPENVVLISGPGAEIDIDHAIVEGREIFTRILPDEDFLPKAPNPEDIIYVDDTQAQVADSNGQSEFTEAESSNSNNKSDATKEEGADSKSQSEFKESENSNNQSDATTEKVSGRDNQSESKEEESCNSNSQSEATVEEVTDTSSQSEEHGKTSDK